tara:strand:+ start:2800 stop:3825 length:1026 start_codon:yes stop_codon:yes gene_type:complete
LDLKLLSSYKNIDLRSEKEFHKGTIPGSVNIPILSNDEFENVGKEYKNKGQEAAINLGLQLVKGDLKNKRIDAWKNHLNNNPGCFIFCYRGGLRSKIAQEWLEKENIIVQRISGGYKNFRSNILDEHVNSKYDINKWMIIGGLTGSGKTALLSQFKETIDLEKIANHRGSAFGKNISPQPSQADFENELTLKYINHSHSNILLEDESRSIGRVTLPGTWYEKMQSSKLVVLKISTDERVNNILDEYVLQILKTSNNVQELLNQYLFSLEKIKKRLGDKLFKEISDLMIKAFKMNHLDSHKKWISKLLIGYYDPMYNYKLKLRKEYIVHIGDDISCFNYIVG